MLTEHDIDAISTWMRDEPADPHERATGQPYVCVACAWTGLGASMVEDLDSTRKKYARVKRAERPDWVREQMEVIQEEREAKAYAALDALLESI